MNRPTTNGKVIFRTDLNRATNEPIILRIPFMHIGVCRIWLTISESHSLKQKRQVVKSIIDRLKHRFNIAVAEVDALDAHQQAVIGVVSISNDRRHLDRILSHVVRFVESTCLAELTDYEIEILY